MKSDISYPLHIVIPAKTGIHNSADDASDGWLPAFAGTTRPGFQMS